MKLLFYLQKYKGYIIILAMAFYVYSRLNLDIRLSVFNYELINTMNINEMQITPNNALAQAGVIQVLPNDNAIPASDINDVQIASPTPKQAEEVFSLDEISNEDERSYVERFLQTALTEQKEFKIPASITLGQGILESNSGKSSLAREANNHFGIKCFEKKCKKGHCVNKTDDSHKDFFLKFPTAWDSYRWHSNLLQKKIYTKARECGNDYKCWAHELEMAGYATDKQYEETLLKVIQRNKLYLLDK